MTSDGNDEELLSVSPSADEGHGENNVPTKVAEDAEEANTESLSAKDASAVEESEESTDKVEESDEDEGKSEPRKGRRTAMAVRSGRKNTGRKPKAENEGDDDSDSEEDSPIETASLEVSEDDPLGPAYDLDDGKPIEPVAEQLPWKSEVRSAKEFFNTEVLYRFDIIEPQYLEPIKGSFRVELKGAQGGVWSFTVGEQLDVVNAREEADTVLSMSQQDFIDIVNGTLNPQLAILSQKVKITGDAKKAILVQELLAPAVE